MLRTDRNIEGSDRKEKDQIENRRIRQKREGSDRKWKGQIENRRVRKKIEGLEKNGLDKKLKVRQKNERLERHVRVR